MFLVRALKSLWIFRTPCLLPSETSRISFWALTHAVFGDPLAWVEHVFILYHNPGELRVAFTKPGMSLGAGTTDPQPSTGLL